MGEGGIRAFASMTDEVFALPSSNFPSGMASNYVGFHRMRIPLAVYCVIRRVRPTNSKFHPSFTRISSERSEDFTPLTPHPPQAVPLLPLEKAS